MSLLEGDVGVNTVTVTHPKNRHLRASLVAPSLEAGPRPPVPAAAAATQDAAVAPKGAGEKKRPRPSEEGDGLASILFEEDTEGLESLQKRYEAIEARRKKMRKTLVVLRKKVGTLESTNENLRHNTTRLWQHSHDTIKAKQQNIMALRKESGIQ